MFVVWPPPCTEGDEACDISATNLIVNMAGSIRERLEVEALLESHVEGGE
jgi:hypothetical protein